MSAVLGDADPMAGEGGLAPALLEVTSAVALVDLEVGGDEAAVEFTVTNVGERAAVAAVRARFPRGPQPDWFLIDGPDRRVLEPDASETYRLRVKVPRGAEPLDYRVSLQAYAPDHPGEVYFSGPWVWLAARDGPEPDASPVPRISLPVATAGLLGLLVVAAGLALTIEPMGARAPAAWLPKAWTAGAACAVQVLVALAAHWVLYRAAPVEPGARRPGPSCHVLASTVPSLALLCGALLWSRAGWPWLVPSLIAALSFGWAMVARALRLRRLQASGGESSRVPAWWIVAGLGLVVLLAAATAVGIAAGRAEAPVAAPASVDPTLGDLAAADAGIGDRVEGAATWQVLLATALLGVPLAAVVAVTLLWLWKRSGPGFAISLGGGVLASIALLAVLGAALWRWLDLWALLVVVLLAVGLGAGYAIVSVRPGLRLFVALLVVLVVLYGGSASLALKHESGDMERAMAQTRELVADAREEIRKEMNKPFILRLFGSLFGMEGNSFQKLKERLPPILKSAMPKVTAEFSFTAPAGGIAVEGMRLVDALLTLQARGIALRDVRWTFDDSVSEERYVQLGGTVLEASLEESGATFVIQMFHGYDQEEGIGTDAEARQAALAALAAQAVALAAAPQPFQQWLVREDEEKRRALAEAGFPLAAWLVRPIPQAEVARSR